MKLLLLVVAFIGLAKSDEIADLIAAKLFIKCCNEAMNGGIESIPVPNYNPLVIKDYVYSNSSNIAQFSISITNNVLYNLLDYNFTKLEATSYSNPARVAYDYEIYWPKLNLTGNYEILFKTLVFETNVAGTYNVALYDVDWIGVFNLTKPGQEDQGIPMHLDDLTVVSKAQSAEVVTTGITNAWLVEGFVKINILALINNLPASVADTLKDNVFNGYWIDHPERINGIIENCVL